ncbi:MAG: glycosyltransferase 87 family protein, partial [Thermoleophilaceae bacterium]
VLALLSLGVSLAFYDRGQLLVSVPLVYPPLLYLLARLATAGFRGLAPSSPPVGRVGERTLIAALLVLVAARIGFDLAFGHTTDVAYASVVGANSIHHGWPLYSAAYNHLDTYGPVTYLAYLPFELVFPMHSGWQHDYLPAARAAAIVFDLLTMAGLFVLGGKLRAGQAGRRLGLVLAFAWAAFPFTFMTLAINTNDGLVSLLVVLALLAISSPRVRGALIGLAVAAKFAPAAIAGVLAAGTGDRRLRSLATFGALAALVLTVSVWAYLPDGGLTVFWNNTLGFQMHRHSFLSIWGQYPGLGGLREAVELATVALAVAAFIAPRRRTLAQVAALGGAVLIAVELSLVYWLYTYVVWFLPLAFAGLLAAGARETVAEGANIRAWPTWRPTASSGYAPATPQP